MGWIQYYNLLEQYSGDLSKATKEEMNWAARGNPNDPHSARALAEKKYKEENNWRCGEGENRCNCKDPTECGYKQIDRDVKKIFNK